MENRKKRRIGIFLFYDTKGKVYEYVEYMLSDIIQCLDELVIVTNGYLREDGRDTLKKFSDKIFERPNKGFDAAAWKEAMVDYYGLEKIGEYDELILFNDSFFGPFYPFQQIFDEMDTRDIDFWGLSSHGPTPSKENSGPLGDRPAYIQSYFMAFRQSMLRSPAFTDYWKNLKEFSSFDELVENHSSLLTWYFEQAGFRWGVYSDTRDLETENRNISYHMFDSYNMVANRRLPIIKRKSFIMPKIQFLRYGIADSLFRTLCYIDQNTNYDVRLIWDYLLQNYNLYDLKQSLNLNYILDKNYAADHNVKHPAAVIAHLYYEDLFDYSLEYLSRIPKEIDIYITTNSDDKKEMLLEKTEKLCIRICQIIVVKNRGRELSALLVGCAGIPQKYEYLCFYHDKSPQKEFSTVGADFRHLITENTLGSTSYIYNILNLFEKNPQLGLLMPPNVYHASYFSNSLNYWSVCFEETKKILRRLNIDDIIIQEQKDPISVGDVFWCRTKALMPLFDELWEFSDFPREPLCENGTVNHAMELCFPYIAQSQLYFTGTVMTSEYAAAEAANFRYMTDMTMSSLHGLPNISFYNFQSFISSINAGFIPWVNDLQAIAAAVPTEPPGKYELFKQFCRAMIPAPIWDAMHNFKLLIKHEQRNNDAGE